MLTHTAVGLGTGELPKVILIDQFTRLRDGDRFWYENHFADAMVRELEMTTLAAVIRRYLHWRRDSGQRLRDRNPCGRQAQAEAAQARVSIYDVRGRLVRTLARPYETAAWRWDLDAENGTRVKRGLYFVRVETELEQSTHKVFLPE